jgi:hypothetical protein
VGNRKYYSNVIFATSPLTGYYRFKDLFQIYTLPDKERLKFDKETHFPIIIEYWIDEGEKQKATNPFFDGIEDYVSIATLQNNWLNLLTRLLSVFTNHHFFLYDLDKAWYVPLDKEITNSTSSNFGFKYYHILPKLLR